MAGGSVAAARSTAGGEWLGWVASLALAACLRLYGIGSEPLWLDEAYSWWDARQTLEISGASSPSAIPIRRFTRRSSRSGSPSPARALRPCVRSAR